MKNAVFSAIALTFLVSTGVYAGEGHDHSKKKDKQAQHKEHTCEKCKKSEKDCKCDEKHSADGHDHEDEKKESK